MRTSQKDHIDAKTAQLVLGTSAAWLAGTGKSEAWKVTTQRCQELLQKLNLQEKLVQRRLPNLREHARLLVRTPGFDWRTKTAVEYLDAIKEQLLKGGQ